MRIELTTSFVCIYTRSETAKAATIIDRQLQISGRGDYGCAKFHFCR